MLWNEKLFSLMPPYQRLNWFNFQQFTRKTWLLFFTSWLHWLVTSAHQSGCLIMSSSPLLLFRLDPFLTWSCKIMENSCTENCTFWWYLGWINIHGEANVNTWPCDLRFVTFVSRNGMACCKQAVLWTN